MTWFHGRSLRFNVVEGKHNRWSRELQGLPSFLAISLHHTPPDTPLERNRQVAGHLAVNWIFAISLYFPEGKLTAKFPANWPPTFPSSGGVNGLLSALGAQSSCCLWGCLVAVQGWRFCAREG